MAGEVETFYLTVKGTDLTAVEGRPLQDIELREINTHDERIQLKAVAVAIDLFAWFHEVDDDRPAGYPNGTLLSFVPVHR